MIDNKVLTVKRLIDEVYAAQSVSDRQMKAILVELKTHIQDKIDAMPSAMPMNKQGPAEEMVDELKDST